MVDGLSYYVLICYSFWQVHNNMGLILSAEDGNALMRAELSRIISRTQHVVLSFGNC